jgi:hypothetical protein
VPFLRTCTLSLLDVRFGANLRYFDGYVKVESNNDIQAQSEEKDFSFPLPLAYLGATISPPALPFSIQLDGMGVVYQDAYYYDLEGKLKFTVFSVPTVGKLFVGIGYKWQRLQLKNDIVDDVEGKMTFKGIMGEIGMEFWGK